MSYKLYWKPRGFIVQYHGVVTSSDIMSVINEIHSNPHFDRLLYGISEYSQVTRYDVTSAQIIIHAAYWSGAAASNPTMVLASVTTNEDIIKVLSAIINSKMRRKLCSTLDEAKAWIMQETKVEADLDTAHQA